MILATPEQLTAIYERDLRTSFPPSELKPLHTIQSLYRSGHYRPYCLLESGQIIGSCFLWLGRPGWALLDYLCVPSRQRNAGVGAELIAQMRAACPDTVVLAESEAPESAPDPAMAKRRLRFYARTSARLASYDTEMFGVRYKTLYWSDGVLPDEELIQQHRFIYQSSFAPAKFARYVRIPQASGAVPTPRVPWDEA